MKHSKHRSRSHKLATKPAPARATLPAGSDIPTLLPSEGSVKGLAEIIKLLEKNRDEAKNALDGTVYCLKILLQASSRALEENSKQLETRLDYVM